MTDLRGLANHARRIAVAAQPGSLERRAAGCVAVAASTTRTLTAARTALADVRLPNVREAAYSLLDRLAASPVATEGETSRP